MTKSTLAGLAWRNHFRRNLMEEMAPTTRDSWGPGEWQFLGPSLAEFQLGESSGGRHLLRYAREFGDRMGDPWLAEAMALFIQEENRHSHWLGEFLKAQHYPLLRGCWSDGVFRVLRKLMGFGMMSAVLVCAEVVAVPYYSAVQRTTASLWLRSICTRLLRDEEIHLRFQAANLGAVWSRWPAYQSLRGAHRLLQLIVCLAVWRPHGEVLRRGGYTRLTFLAHCRELLDGVHANAAALTEEPAKRSNSKGEVFAEFAAKYLLFLPGVRNRRPS
ncbi:MAG: hypothetical protein HYX27_11370 [Acidobacteria bacterium]|nr:hypothetical protein [Acidobacteriota bacterium]